VGKTALEGIACFELYKKVFEILPYSSHCVYNLEMQPWEKALNAARKLKAPKMKTIGFQHAGLSKNYFFYFHHSSEIREVGEKTALPLPDIVACNGDIPLNFMKNSGYPNVEKVESIRYLYLLDYRDDLDLDEKNGRMKVLFVPLESMCKSIFLNLCHPYRYHVFFHLC